jgi:hypothetical protein
MTTQHTNPASEKIRLESMMSEKQKKETGLNKLSAAERQELDQFCNTHFTVMRQRGGQGPKPNTPVIPPP